jgi:GNAT superfamily N-acetyltransferase
MLIREAQPADAGALARVHVASWRTTYAGIIPADFLARLSSSQREPFLQGTLTNPDPWRFNLVAEEAGKIIGFASGGPERNNDPIYKGELHAIYLLADYQRRGIGRQLTAAVAARLLQQGMASMLVWVLADNRPARAFYERLGGQLLVNKEKELVIGGVPLGEVAYGWTEIQSLAISEQ